MKWNITIMIIHTELLIQNPLWQMERTMQQKQENVGGEYLQFFHFVVE